MNTMIDPHTQLAFSLYSHKGVYALLLGSGISRAAGIPTGWEVTLDLIRRIATAEGENCEPEPDAWYQSKYGHVPDYSNLLARLGGTQAERQQILRGYFEATTEEEREEGKKQPTAAHKAIADLVKSGYIRVIVTTNFDRLMEQALEAVGVMPTVISSVDALKGAPPLVHTHCTIIKVHGDYLDSRIKNTPDELNQYDTEMDKRLDQVADEYGLIVCGWSADYDPALCAAIVRAPNRRYSTFWAYRGRLGDEATRVINHRQAVKVEIKDADSFFSGLGSKVQALSDVAGSQPVSRQIAVANLKRYLQDAKPIRVFDLIGRETERVKREMASDFFDPYENRYTGPIIVSRIQRYEALMESLIALFATGVYWGDPIHNAMWVQNLEYLADPVATQGNDSWINLARYPALLSLYAGGITALAANKIEVFADLLTKTTIRERGLSDGVAATYLVPGHVITPDAARWLPGTSGSSVSASLHLRNSLREPLRELIPNDQNYIRLFHEFEYLAALVGADLTEKEGNGSGGFFGCFIWHGDYRKIYADLRGRATAAGNNWPFLKAGLFSGTLDRFLQMQHLFNRDVPEIHRIFKG